MIMLLRGQIFYTDHNSLKQESRLFKKYQSADVLKEGDSLPDRDKDFKVLEDFAHKFGFKIVARYLSYHMTFGYHIATIEVA